MTAVFDMSQFSIISQGHSAFQLLWAGVKLGLYDELSISPGISLDEVSARLSISHYPSKVLLVGLTALGVIEKRNDAYFNSDLTERLLVSGRPDSFVPILAWQAHIVYPGLQDLVESLRTGTNVGLSRFPGDGLNLYQRLANHPNLERIFQDAMASLSRQANSNLVTSYDFSRFSHIIDVGGGDATNAINIALHYPHLRITVFDSPSVCKTATHNVHSAGLDHRICVRAGDLWADSFPSGVDAVLFCHMLTIWSMKQNLELLKKCHDALTPDGSVIVFNMMASDDLSGPIITALGSPYFIAIATGQGMLHTWADYEKAIFDAGFGHVKRVEGWPFDHGVIVGTKCPQSQ